jgi:pyruvate/2-oxoglutarate dehydrogenase complex dihydrolipoamide dehydrogenase (E3) component
VEVDDHLRTRNSRIYACGDVCLESKFTHVADFSARIVIQNALFALGPLGRRKVSSLVVPRVTYTDPEIAHVGLGFREIQTGTTPFDVFSVPFASVDRSIAEDETEGFARVWVERATDRILGATLVGAGAGELVSELTLALRAGLGLSAIAATIHPYPTRSEVLRKLGDQYQRTRLTPRSRSLLQALLAIGRWRG